MDFVNFENKKIFVSGASSGIGRAVAILLSKLNARIILNGRNEIELNNTLKGMENADKHIIMPFDVNDYDNYEKYFDKCIEDEKKISGFVYTTGICKVVPLRAINEKDIDDVFNTNIKSFMLMTSMLSKNKYSEHISIVSISSIAVYMPILANIIFAASKGAMDASIKAMAIELAKKGSRINSVIPSCVETNIIKDMDKEKVNKARERSLLDLATVDDIANVVAFLLSDRAKCITGHSIFADSGYLGQFC